MDDFRSQPASFDSSRHEGPGPGPEQLLELGDLPLDDDAALLERVRTLVQRGFVRRLWLVLLDDESRQLPVMPQIEEMPRSPGADAVQVLAQLLDQVGEFCTAVAFVLERPGRPRPEPDDLAWADAIARAASGSPVRLRAVLLAHGVGVDPVEPSEQEPPRIVAA